MTEAEANALQRQIDDLGDRMDKNFNEIKAMLQDYEKRIRGLENEQAGCQPLTNARLTAVETLIRSHDNQIQALNQTVEELQSTNKFLAFIGGTAGGALILWLVGQFLGLIGK